MAIRFSIPCFAALKPDASAREKILTAASELLLNDGFSALTQQAVAARAGVRQSHITYYFPTRNDLLRATAQFGVETLLDPTTIANATASATAAGRPSVEVFRTLLMPDKTDRQWFRLMTGLLIASDEDESIRPWLCEFDERIVEKLASGFAAIGIHITLDQLHFLHSTFIGALHLDMKEQTDESFARVERTVSMALDLLLPPPHTEMLPIHTEFTPTLTERPLHKSHVKTV
jgi:AcrR family transcriptional regulator